LTEKQLLQIAISLGYNTRLAKENSWEIIPKTTRSTWMLTQTESRWILSIQNIPQLILNEQEAIAFLESQQESNG
jgi:hypothetical protein